jgi:hypothetical protein
MQENRPSIIANAHQSPLAREICVPRVTRPDPPPRTSTKCSYRTRSASGFSRMARRAASRQTAATSAPEKPSVAAASCSTSIPRASCAIRPSWIRNIAGRHAVAMRSFCFFGPRMCAACQRQCACTIKETALGGVRCTYLHGPHGRAGRRTGSGLSARASATPRLRGGHEE